MMRSMIAVIEKDPVEPRAREVAGVIVRMIFVATIVLEIIRPHNTPSRIIMGQNHKKQGALPIDKKQHHLHAHDREHF